MIELSNIKVQTIAFNKIYNLFFLTIMVKEHIDNAQSIKF